MPRYEVTSPDGKRFEVNAPDGATQDQVLAYAQKQFSAPQEPTGPKQAPYFSGEGQKQLLGRRLKQVELTALQAAKPMSGLLATAGGLAEKVTGGGPMSEYLKGLPLRVDEASEQAREDAEAMNPTGLDPGDVEELATQIAVTAPAGNVRALAAGVARPAAEAAKRLANRAISGAATGAAMGNQTDDTGTSAALGAAVNVAAPVLGKVVRGADQTGAAARLARKGVQITPGGIAGGAAKRAEEALSSVPVVGAAIKSSQRAGVESFNVAAINEALAPIGEKLPKGYVGRPAIAQANKRLCDAYNDLLPKMVAKEDAQFRADLQGLVAAADQLPAPQKEKLLFIVKNELATKFLPGGVVRGESLKRIESKLGKLYGEASRSRDTYDNQMAEAIGDAQAALRGLLARNNPQHAKRLEKINEGYTLFKRVQRASRMAGSKKGVFSPEALRSSVAALDPSKDKSSTAKGAAKMQQLAEDAVEVLGSRVPDSGTAERVGMGALLATLSGGAAISPGVALPAVGAMLPYLPGGRQAAQALMLRRPAGAVPLAEAIEASGAPAAIPLTQLLLNGGP